MGFQRSHSLAQDMIHLWPVRRAPDMHDSVFSCGLDGLDLVQLHKRNLAWGFDSQSSELTCRCRRLTQEREKATGGNAGLFVGNELPRPLDRLLEPTGLEWLQEVIQCTHLERPKRVLVVSRREDHNGQRR